MEDSFGRTINYIRISVTDRCNYRCIYCMPPEGIESVPAAELLTFEEIVRICEIAASLGISRLKLTGGEPLVRRGVPALTGMLKGIPGIEQVTMTTNGALLEKHLDTLVENGLDAVNISLDTLDPNRFSQVTRGGVLSDVLKGIHAAMEAGIPVKLNTVLYQGDDWKALAAFAKDLPADVRFIEAMPIGRGAAHAGASKDEVLAYLADRYGRPEPDFRVHGNGPARYYRLPGFKGAIGLITPIHGVFCGSCNRIRLSSTGQIKPCLCYGGRIDLRESLRKGDYEEVRRRLVLAIRQKPQAHSFLETQNITEKRPMASFGG